MEFVEVIKQKERMCEGLCYSCPLSSRNNGTLLVCDDFVKNYPEEAEQIIMKWAEEHPIKTNIQVLEEVLKEKFGDIFDVSQFGCLQFKDRHCSIECCECEFYNFWDKEYKGVSKDESSN